MSSGPSLLLLVLADGSFFLNGLPEQKDKSIGCLPKTCAHIIPSTNGARTLCAPRRPEQGKSAGQSAPTAALQGPHTGRLPKTSRRQNEPGCRAETAV